MKERWLKVRVEIWPLANLRLTAECVAEMVDVFEKAFAIRHLYYARYTDLKSTAFEVSVLTRVAEERLSRFFMDNFKNQTVGVRVEDRGEGSLAHAYAYQAVKRIKPFENDLAEDNDFLDVLHWMANQRGLDYLREARLHAFEALRITHHRALESDRLQVFLRRHSKAIKKLENQQMAEDMIAMFEVKGSEKGQGSVKATHRGQKRQHSESAPSASRKGRGSSGSRSSG